MYVAREVIQLGLIHFARYYNEKILDDALESGMIYGGCNVYDSLTGD